MTALASGLARDDHAGVLEDAQMLHDAESRHREMIAQLRERLPVAREERIEQRSAAGVGERLENLVHCGDYM
jgi:hypothetical protein